MRNMDETYLMLTDMVIYVLNDSSMKVQKQRLTNPWG